MQEIGKDSFGKKTVVAPRSQRITACYYQTLKCPLLFCDGTRRICLTASLGFSGGGGKGGGCPFQEKAKNVKIYYIALLQQAECLYSSSLIFSCSLPAFGHFPFSCPSRLLCLGHLIKPWATFSHCIF